jgi:hypothetical protein
LSTKPTAQYVSTTVAGEVLSKFAHNRLPPRLSAKQVFALVSELQQ